MYRFKFSFLKCLAVNDKTTFTFSKKVSCSAEAVSELPQPTALHMIILINENIKITDISTTEICVRHNGCGFEI